MDTNNWKHTDYITKIIISFQRGFEGYKGMFGWDMCWKNEERGVCLSMKMDMKSLIRDSKGITDPEI